MIGAEPHPVFAQRRARGLIEILHLGGNFGALQHAECLDQLERDAAPDAGDVFGPGQPEQRPQQLFDMRLQPQIEPGLHRLARCAGQTIVGNNAQARMQGVLGSDELGHRIASPADGRIRGQHELIVGRSGQFLGACLDFTCERFLRRGLQRLGVGAGLRRIRGKGESVEAANHMAFNDHFAGLADFRIQNTVLPQAAHQYTGPAVNETLR